MLTVCLLAGIGVLVGSGGTRAGAAEPDARFAKARTFTKAGKYASAIVTYEAILKDRPTDRQALIRVGPLYFLTADYERARYRFVRATRKRPQFAKGWYFYAYALRKLGRYAKALVAYRAYRKLAPADPHAFYGMADCYRALGKAEPAAKAYEQFASRASRVRKGPDMKPWILRARREAQRLRLRLTELRSSAAIKKVLAAARKAIRDGQHLQAEKLLVAAVKRYDGHPLLANELAGLLIRMRRFGEAVPLLRRALKKRRGYFDAQYRLALTLRKTGDLKGAAKAYRAVLKIKSNHPDSHYGYAETLYKLGQLKMALGVYKKYVVLEQRAVEQHWVTKARERIAVIQKQLVTRARPRPAAPVAARPTPSGDPSLAGVTDPRIRALLLARQRFLKRQRGEDVSGGAQPAAPRTSPGESAADRRRRRREELRRKAAERRRKWRELQAKRAEERKRRAAERKRRYLEARRKRAEALARRREEARRKREAYRRKIQRRKNERLATGVLKGRGKLTPEIREILVGWAGKAGDAGKTARAFTIWQRLAELKPGDRTITKELAGSAMAAGEYRAAVGAYRTLIKASPKKMALYDQLRRAEAKAGMKLTPLPLKAVLPPVVLAGRRLIRAGQAAQALRLANQRLRAKPADGHALVLKGDALLRLRRLKAARAAAYAALRANPTLAGPHRVLGGVHLKLRDRSAALAEYKKFLRKVRRDPSEVPHLARIKTLAERLDD